MERGLRSYDVKVPERDEEEGSLQYYYRLSNIALDTLIYFAKRYEPKQP
jgi:hypothetical protein